MTKMLFPLRHFFLLLLPVKSLHSVNAFKLTVKASSILNLFFSYFSVADVNFKEEKKYYSREEEEERKSEKEEKERKGQVSIDGKSEDVRGELLASVTREKIDKPEAESKEKREEYQLEAFSLLHSHLSKLSTRKKEICERVYFLSDSVYHIYIY